MFDNSEVLAVSMAGKPLHLVEGQTSHFAHTVCGEKIRRRNCRTAKKPDGLKFKKITQVPLEDKYCEECFERQGD